MVVGQSHVQTQGHLVQVLDSTQTKSVWSTAFSTSQDHVGQPSCERSLSVMLLRYSTTCAPAWGPGSSVQGTEMLPNWGHVTHPSTLAVSPFPLEDSHITPWNWTLESLETCLSSSWVFANPVVVQWLPLGFRALTLEPTASPHCSTLILE